MKIFGKDIQPTLEELLQMDSRGYPLLLEASEVPVTKRKNEETEKQDDSYLTNPPQPVFGTF